MALLKTLNDYFLVLFGGSFTRGIALLNALIIARLLGPANFGIFSIFYAVMVLTWQLPQAFDGVYVAYAKKFDSRQKKNDLLKSTIFLKACCLLLIILCAYPLTVIIARYGFHKDIQLPLLTALFTGGFVMFLMTVASTFQEEERFARFALINAIYTLSVFVCLLVIFLFRIELTLHLIFGIYLIVSFIIGIGSIISLYRRVGNPFVLNKNILKEAFAQGKWLFAMVAVSCIFSRVDVLFLTRYIDFQSIGIYAVAAQLVLIVDHATGALAGICLPKAGAAVRSKESLNAFFKESIWVILLIEAGIFLFIIIAPFVVTLLYGQEYALAGHVLRILLCGWVLRIIFIPFSFIFIALGDSRTKFYLELWKIIIGISLLFWLVPRYGLIGGAISIALTYSLETVVSMVVLRYRLNRAFKEPCLT